MACHDHSHEEKTACSTGGGSCEGKKTCSIWGIIIPSAVLFVVIMVFNYLFHGNLMAPHYEATKNLWRSAEEMETLKNICFLRTAAISIVLTLIYCCHTACKPCGGKCPSTGMKFGLMIGLLLGLWDFGSYIWMPIPMNLGFSWLFGDVVLGLLIGFALSATKRFMCKG